MKQYSNICMGEFKYIMVYQDHLTKFTMLEALKTKSAQEVPANLVNIFRTCERKREREKNRFIQ